MQLRMRKEKKMHKNISLKLIFACLVFGVVSAFGCSPSGESGGGLHLGEIVPETAPVVKLADVLAAPVDYDGKKIVLQGTVVSQCASLCDFSFQDGARNITVYPKGFKLPQLERGKPVTVYAEVIKGEGQVVFSLLGLEME